MRTRRTKASPSTARYSATIAKSLHASRPARSTHIQDPGRGCRVQSGPLLRVPILHDGMSVQCSGVRLLQRARAPNPEMHHVPAPDPGRKDDRMRRGLPGRSAHLRKAGGPSENRPEKDRRQTRKIHRPHLRRERGRRHELDVYIREYPSIRSVCPRIFRTSRSSKRRKGSCRQCRSC